MKSALVAIVLFFAALLLYWPRAAVSVQESDGGEMATAAVTGDLLHPPGYPLYAMMARGVVQLEPSAPYQALARFSVVLQSLAVALLFLASSRLSGSAVVGGAVAASWMLYEPTIRTAVDADVFALQQCLALLVVLSCLPLYAGDRSTARFFLSGLCCGLGGSHHHTVVFFAPLVLGAIVSGPERRDFKTFSRMVFPLLGGVLIGLLPYSYLFFQKGGLAYAPVTSVSAFFHHLLRRDYGTFSMHAGVEKLPSYLVPFLTLTIRELPAAVIACASMVLFFRHSILGAALFLTSLLHLWFASKLQMPPDLVLYGEFAMRHYVIVALALSLSLAFVAGRTLKGLPMKMVVSLLIIIPSLACAPSALAGGDAASDRVIEQELNAVMKEVPKDGIFLAASDRIAMGSLFRQRVFHQREDILILVVSLLGNERYRDVLRSEGGFAEEIADKAKSYADLLSIAESRDRTITSYVELPPPEGIATWPLGVTWQWLAESVPVSREEVGMRWLSFCARWPDEFKHLNPRRVHSKFIYGALFLEPLTVYRSLGGVPEIAEVLEIAAKHFRNGEVEQGRAECRTELKSRFGRASVDAQPYSSK